MPVLGENADMTAPIADAAAQALAIPTEGMLDGEEAYDGGPPFRVHLLVLTE